MEPIKIVTFLLSRGVVWDPWSGEATISSIVHLIAINPDTHTNDRHQVVIEFEHQPVEKMDLLFRIRRTGEEPATVYEAAWGYDPKKSDSGTWFFITLPSLPPEYWKVGHPHTMELLHSGHPIAGRALGCVPIEDSPCS